VVNEKQSHWASLEEVGTYWLLRLMVFLYGLLGRYVFLVILYPVVSYYFLMHKQARLASLDYLRHVDAFIDNSAIKANLFQSYRHFLQFADSMLDKVSAWNTDFKIDDVIIHGHEAIDVQIGLNRGCLILGSHLGNVEVCRALIAKGQQAKMNILVHTKNAKNFNRLLDKISTSRTVELIQVTEIGPALAISLEAKIADGEFVFIVADRIPVKNTGRTSPVTFLGEQAHLPQGPFILAALLRCPVYTLFCLKQSGVYHLYFDHFSDRIEIPRKNREAIPTEFMQHFALRMQRYCLIAPLQWFNFYHYWETPYSQPVKQ
jgi:predicted LPLAT superfamily acyltransferase